MFAVTSPRGGCSFKCSDIAFEGLTESGVGRPAPYLARAKWVRLDSLDAMPDEDLVRAIRQLLTDSPFHGEGYRKLWARLRLAGIRTSRCRLPGPAADA